MNTLLAARLTREEVKFLTQSLLAETKYRKMLLETLKAGMWSQLMRAIMNTDMIVKSAGSTALPTLDKIMDTAKNYADQLEAHVENHDGEAGKYLAILGGYLDAINLLVSPSNLESIIKLAGGNLDKPIKETLDASGQETVKSIILGALKGLESGSPGKMGSALSRINATVKQVLGIKTLTKPSVTPEQVQAVANEILGLTPKQLGAMGHAAGIKSGTYDQVVQALTKFGITDLANDDRVFADAILGTQDAPRSNAQTAPTMAANNKNLGTAPTVASRPVPTVNPQQNNAVTKPGKIARPG